MAANLDVFEELKRSLLKEIQDLILEKSTANYENALAFNQELQSRLQQVIQRLHELLKAVRIKYAENEKALKTRKNYKTGVGARGALLRGGTFYFKGNLYFRDFRGRCCPNTPDYIERSNAGEIFPMDFNLRARHIWTLCDKSIVIKAIKAQIIEEYELIKQPKVNKRKLLNEVHSKKLVDLMAYVEADKNKKFKIDWNQIAAIDIGYRHSANSCEAMWQVYLLPKLKRGPWSEAEDSCLMAAVKEYNYQDWESIAAAVGRRSDYQCFVRYTTKLSYLDRKCLPWRDEDDKRLLDEIEKCKINGTIDWAEVMAHFPNKNKSTLIGRYYNTLNPNISREPFSAQEDMLLLAAVEEYNGQFYRIPKSLFPNRSLPQLRARYKNTLSQRAHIAAWSESDDQRLLEFVSEHGISQWLECANQFGHHTRQSCRTRYLTIKKFFEKNPNANISDLPRKRTRPSKNGIDTQNWLTKLYDFSNEEHPQKIQKLSCEELSSDKHGGNKRLYLERLRNMQLNLYHFFKYSYNMRVDADGATECPVSNLGLRICMSSLSHRHPMTGSQHKYDLSLPKSLRYCYNDTLRQPKDDVVPTGYKLPPSWYTAIGFRTLCIQWALSDLVKQPTQVTHCDDIVQQNEHLKTFRQRLRALFYKTIMLCRMQPNDIAGLSDALKLAKFPHQQTTDVPARVYVPVHRAANIYELDVSQKSADKFRLSLIKCDVDTNDQEEHTTFSVAEHMADL